MAYMAGGLGTLRLQVKYPNHVVDTDSESHETCTEFFRAKECTLRPSHRANRLQDRHDTYVEEVGSSLHMFFNFFMLYFIPQII